MPTVTDASPDQLEDLIAAGSTVIDVRSAEDFTEGHIPGSTNIPANPLLADPGLLSPMLGDATALAVVCTRGHTSRRTAEALAEADSLAMFGTIHSLDGGVVAWERSGRTLEAGA